MAEYATVPCTDMGDILREVWGETERQMGLWGPQNHPDGTGGPIFRDSSLAAHQRYDDAVATFGPTWQLILDEEVQEVFAETDPARIREELVQVAAVAASWIEAIDRRVSAP